MFVSRGLDSWYDHGQKSFKNKFGGESLCDFCSFQCDPRSGNSLVCISSERRKTMERREMLAAGAAGLAVLGGSAALAQEKKALKEDLAQRWVAAIGG